MHKIIIYIPDWDNETIVVSVDKADDARTAFRYFQDKGIRADLIIREEVITKGV